MNWYKKAQNQNLLFYPFSNDRFREVHDKVYHTVNPTYIDGMQLPHYNCGLCGKDTFEIGDYEEEQNLADWYVNTNNSTNYNIPTNIPKEQMINFLDQLVNILYQFMKQTSQTDSSIETPIEQYKLLYEQINSLPLSQDFKVFVLSLQQSGIGYGRYNSVATDNIKYIYDMIVDERIYSDSECQNVIKSINNLKNYFDEFYLDVAKKSFSVPTKVPICQECYEELVECDFCHEKVLPDQRSFSDDSGRTACNSCTESGEADFCMECNQLFSQDELDYDENAGGHLCRECLEKSEKPYDYFIPKIEEMAEKNPYPFKEWFEGKDRIYLPMVQEINLDAIDNQIISTLDFYNYTTTPKDYQLGYCYKDKGNNSFQKYRIPKALESIFHKKIRDLNNDSNEPAIQDTIKLLKQNLNELVQNFSVSPARKIKDTTGLTVVISQNPHDIAKMSTGRDWTSCMELGKGQYHSDVFCEIKHGALIAYQIRDHDKEIEKPLARLLIRRYENEDGINLALPETKIYGNPTGNFYKTVNDWLMEKQQSLPKGNYNRKGGHWKDRLPDLYTRAQLTLNRMLKQAKSNWYKKFRLEN